MTSAKTLVELIPRKKLVLPYFLKPQHPKSTVAPTEESVKSLLDLGFVAQRKMNGHRAQIHLSSAGDFAAFTRQGAPHTKPLEKEIVAALTRIFKPESGWTVIDCEWQKQQGKLYIFDLLKVEGESLKTKTYKERFALLKSLFSLDPKVEFLPLLKSVKACMEVLADTSPFTEGLVFRNLKSIGFDDSAIIRCRKNGIFFNPEKLT